MRLKNVLAAALLAAVCAPAAFSAPLFSSQSLQRPIWQTEGTTLSGAAGHIVTPGAGLLWEDASFAAAAGYTFIAVGGSFAQIPFVHMHLADQVEITAALDTRTDSINLLAGSKWRFYQGASSAAALGFLGQLTDIGPSMALGGQLYAVATFAGAILEWPAATSILVGYTMKKQGKSDIDFSVGFQTPLLPAVFENRISFLFDVGNVSYSMNPSAADAQYRGTVNAGLRMNPMHLGDSMRMGLQLSVLDIFDGGDRALALGMNVQLTN